MAGQGYGYLGLSTVQLRGEITVGWAALDRTVHVHIALGFLPNINARWGGGFEIVTKPRVGQ